MHTTTKTQLLGIFGYPVAHSLSPKLHSILAEKTDTDVVYLAFSVPPEEFGEKINAAKALCVRGLNITVPHKMRVMEYLDKVDEGAQIIGSVNTVVNENGILNGYSTDGIGFLRSLKSEGISLEDKNVLLLGAGGTARSIAYTVSKHGAKTLTVSSRTEKNIRIIGDIIEKNTDTVFFDCDDITKKYDIIINATPLGMAPHENENPFSRFDSVDSDTFCYDAIYSPLETLFLKESKSRGAKTMNGLGMLFYQGLAAFEYFFNTTLSEDICRETFDTFTADFRK